MLGRDGFGHAAYLFRIAAYSTRGVGGAGCGVGTALRWELPFSPLPFRGEGCERGTYTGPSLLRLGSKLPRLRISPLPRREPSYHVSRRSKPASARLLPLPLSIPQRIGLAPTSTHLLAN